MTMATVREGTQTEEEKAETEAEVKGLQDQLFKSLDLEADGPAGDGGKDAEQEPEAKPEGEDDGEKSSEEKAEDDAPEGEKLTEEKAGEELVPKSRVDKMIARQEHRINQLTAELRQLKASPKADPNGDPERDKLSRMTAVELKSLKREVRIAQATEKDTAKLEQLVDLELKIDEVSTEAPSRFVARQVELYNAAADELLQDAALDDVEQAAPKIRGIAQQIYGRYPKLQHLEEGQAIALQLAAEHYKATAGGNGAKERTTAAELRRKINTLKRRTGLDAGRSGGSPPEPNLTKLREKAFRGAEDKDRISLIKTDPLFAIDSLIPEEYKDR